MIMPKFWPVPVALLTAIAIFAGTYYAYAERHRLQEEGSPLPGVIGLGLFAITMTFLTDRLLPEEGKRRSLILVGVVAGETAAFFFILLFLLLNTLGS